MVQLVHREVHFWNEALSEPPCGTPDDRFVSSSAIEGVTCEGCLEALAGDGGDLASYDEGSTSQPPAS